MHQVNEYFTVGLLAVRSIKVHLLNRSFYATLYFKGAFCTFHLTTFI